LRVLILYTELAGYVLGNIKRFLIARPDAKLLLIHYPVNPEAPFELKAFTNSEFIEFDVKMHNTIQEKINDFHPDLVMCSGWSNSFYINSVKKLPKACKCIICFDNQWKGTLKQRILVLFSKFFLLKWFQYAWVPGLPQKQYALRMGFPESNVFTGLYPADTALFTKVGQVKVSEKGKYPKTLLSVARYIPQKDLPNLWNAFIAANAKCDNTWNLKCIGLGELYDERIENPHIEHLGFKQPAEIDTYILEAGVFVLPSIEEPWGVAVHEMALSALPMVLSNKVGAASMFLKNGNGYEFEAGNAKSLEEALLRIMNMDSNTLKAMGAISFVNGQQLLSQDWTKTLIHIYEI
jgi:glycosyltransferase involved in cell wall biosynthesis